MGNELRNPDRIILYRVPEITGKKSTRLSLYRAQKWRVRHHLEGDSFYPKVPKQTQARNEYFRDRYRVMIGTMWLKIKGFNYVMLTAPEIYSLLEELLQGATVEEISKTKPTGGSLLQNAKKGIDIN